jgi:hypothetical protein
MEKRVIDFLMKHGLWEYDFYSYKVIPKFTENMWSVGPHEEDGNKYTPSRIEYDSLHRNLYVVYLNVDDNRDYHYVPFSSHTNEEQNTLEQMISFIMENI